MSISPQKPSTLSKDSLAHRPSLKKQVPMNKGFASAMHEFMKKMGFYNITKLQELN